MASAYAAYCDRAPEPLACLALLLLPTMISAITRYN